MRVEQKIKLIDFDASVSYTNYEESSCSKYSSGYLPPELIHCDNFKVCVKSCLGFDIISKEQQKHPSSRLISYSSSVSEKSSEDKIPFFTSKSSSFGNSKRLSTSLSDNEKDEDKDEDEDEGQDEDNNDIVYNNNENEENGFYGFEPVPPSPSQDIWSLGLILFHLASNSSLFNCDGEGNIDDIQLRLLGEWNDNTKTQQLLRVKNSYARNLISLMLMKDPKKRLSIAQVLSHSFLTGKKSTRFAGDIAKYDVFISYRVNSDLLYAKLLYQLLMSKGVKVWLDIKCLKVGEQWEDGFCNGLLNSTTFLPIISRDAINHSTIIRQNFRDLGSDSPCDNVLLEHRFALELRERGLTEKIFPLFIGDQDREGMYSKYTFHGTYPCHPVCPSVIVDSVEMQLRRDLEKQGQGMPFFEFLTVKEIMTEITCYQGAFIEGDLTTSMNNTVELVIEMLNKEKEKEKEKEREEDKNKECSPRSPNKQRSNKSPRCFYNNNSNDNNNSNNNNHNNNNNANSYDILSSSLSLSPSRKLYRIASSVLASPSLTPINSRMEKEEGKGKDKDKENEEET